MDTISEEIIAMEKMALTRWGNGDSAGFLEISAPDIVYFDPYIACRIDGLESLADYYHHTLWGKVHFDRFELLNPTIQRAGEMAVLTFNYVSYVGDEPSLWNCTEVYRRKSDKWKIIQSHWSYTEVFKNKMGKKKG
jgi:ketosteroid isomerase-like protein